MLCHLARYLKRGSKRAALGTQMSKEGIYSSTQGRATSLVCDSLPALKLPSPPEASSKSHNHGVVSLHETAHTSSNAAFPLLQMPTCSQDVAVAEHLGRKISAWISHVGAAGPLARGYVEGLHRKKHSKVTHDQYCSCRLQGGPSLHAQSVS